LTAASTTASADVQLVPVITGLSNPVFVGHATDGSRRLFIVERDGIVRVAQRAAATATVFMDIRAKIVSGGEQGLLGLAFHPSFQRNGRFFVYYTRSGDGSLVVAEYRISTDPNAADPAEAILLTIPHPINTNHNGGMLAFGPDGYLYIGVGDGGSADDPPNNAQNIEVLLGKILRIDVDRPDLVARIPYSSPPDNPFVNRPGRDEIFAFGLRNPWRFSFDRATGRLWVGDVGQDDREEVDTPIVAGGNYGWRVYEGFACTNNDRSLCTPQNYLSPVFDYTHAGGRCSITGGYVYRGALRSVPDGTYVYGDYCSGEIFSWDGRAQSVVLRTATNISSFGEDEDGEIYVVDLGGTISRIVSTAPVETSCTASISPSRITVPRKGQSGTLTVTMSGGCRWDAIGQDSWISIAGSASGTGSGIVGYTIAPYDGHARYRTGTVTVAGQTFGVIQSR